MNTFHALRAALAAALIGAGSWGAQAHGTNADDISIGHPYATPTPAGMRAGGAYIATLENRGKQADRLLRAATPVAGRVELHTMELADGVMRMREQADIPLPPGAVLKMRPGQGYHLMLMELKQPLKEGDTFPLTLEFERAGKVEVKVVVQRPLARGASEPEHHH
ncbi:MAG TPA: copper chaperone PCu(A)C [Albitalea sp.]|nr:copper chaperone PCu(A)C [Albitalea sp.]